MDIHDDDRPIGRILSRREVLKLLGGTSATMLLGGSYQALRAAQSGETSSVYLPLVMGSKSATSTPTPSATSTSASTPTPSATSTSASTPTATATSTSTVTVTPTAGATTTPISVCVVRPELTEGPVFVEEDELNRSDIRPDPTNGAVSEGTQFDLTFHITQLTDGACTPLSGVQVDIWHCDANGIYSDTDQLGMDTVGQKFLRGYQITDESGVVYFTTIYPGWYEGRTVHIHFKIRTDDGYDFTSQLFFDDSFTDKVYTQAPYNARGERQLRNDDDNIFAQSGNQMMLAVNQVDAGYEASFNVALDLT